MRGLVSVLFVGIQWIYDTDGFVRCIIFFSDSSI